MVLLWGLVLLASARFGLRGLPPPAEVVPPYTLWMPDGGEPPTLDPAPARVHAAPTPPDADRMLVLGRGVRVAPELPRRLAACGPFVSVIPRPRGGPLRLAVERLLRDFANPAAVNDPRHPAGYADARCAWLRRRDLDLPGVGEPGPLRAARARKAHGLAVDLRDGYAGDRPRGPRVVEAPGHGPAELRALVPALTAPEPAARTLMVAIPPALCLAPWLLLLAPAARPAALLAIGLGTAARLMTAVREGFGGALPVLGWVIEPLLSFTVRRAPETPARSEMPPVPADAPALTGAKPVEGAAWLDDAAVPHLARRLGGAAPVMEQIYRNTPAGRTARARAADRWIHAAPAARAVRHRWLAVAELGRKCAPRSLISVPCGSARDAAAIGAGRRVLVDPDPTARRLAAERCAAAGVEAEVIDGTVEALPEGPFDLAIYVGLMEYLDDEEVIAHLATLRARLAPDGALITSTTAADQSQGRMRDWLGWQTRARSADALAALLGRAGFDVAERRVDPLGIQWVMLARPRPPSDRSDRFTSSELRRG